MRGRINTRQCEPLCACVGFRSHLQCPIHLLLSEIIAKVQDSRMKRRPAGGGPGMPHPEDFYKFTTYNKNLRKRASADVIKLNIWGRGCHPCCHMLSRKWEPEQM